MTGERKEEEYSRKGWLKAAVRDKNREKWEEGLKEQKWARNKGPQHDKSQRNMKRRKGEGNERADSGGD